VSSGQAAGFVELSAGTDYGAEALETTRQAFLLAGSAAVLLAAFLGWLMGSRLSAPLAELTRTTARMSAGDLSVRARKTGRDEIGRLAEQFNRMAAQLQASFNQLGAERDSLRRFISDASHELRTPITALKNFNELLQGAAAADPAARLEFLAESQIQIERLEWITRNLLDLSRLEAGLAALEIDRCGLDELINEAAAPFLRQASQKGISLVIHLAGPRLEIQCDRARFQIALANLLDNAVKYTPERGKVEVWTERVDAAIRVTVRDTGPGIDPDDLPHIFERFYRGRGTTAAGSGLGLAIVHSVMQAHGGKVWVESMPDQGTQFTLEWPAA
jgi:signal transduction histidine kinase